MANFIANLQDRLGNALTSVDVYVFAANTQTLLVSTRTNELGEYTIPLTGPLATPGYLVDMEFAGGGIRTFRREGITLLD